MAFPILTTVPEKSHARMLPGVPIGPTSVVAQGSLLLSTQNAVRARTYPVSGIESYCGGFDEDVIISELGNRMFLDRDSVAL